MIDIKRTIYKKVRSFIEQCEPIDLIHFPILGVYRTMYDRLPKDKVETELPVYEYNILLNHYLMSCIERIMMLPSPEYIAYLLPIEIVRIAFSHDIQISEPYPLQQT